MSKKILVVEDEEGVRYVLARLFQKQNYEVETAANGQEGLKKAQEQKFDLIISDIRMPKMSGLEFIKAIRPNNPESVANKNETTPAIAISAILPEGIEVKDLIIAGFNHFLYKPFKLDNMLAIVKQLTEKPPAEP